MREKKLLKKVMSLILCFITEISLCGGVAALSPVTVLALQGYNVWVGGMQFTSGKTKFDGSDGFKGTAEYDHQSHTLTLTDFDNGGKVYKNGDDDTSGIYYNESGPLNLVLEGSSTVTNSEKGTNTYGIYSLEDLTISGSGSLTVTAGEGSDRNIGIYATRGDGAILTIDIEDGELTATGGEGSESAGLFVYNLTMKKGKLTATGGKSGTLSIGVQTTAMEIKGGELTATGGEAGSGSIGVFTTGFKMSGGEMIAQGGTVKDKGKDKFSYGVYFGGSSIDDSIIEGGTLTAIGGELPDSSDENCKSGGICDVRGEDVKLTVSGGRVTARGGNINKGITAGIIGDNQERISIGDGDQEVKAEVTLSGGEAEDGKSYGTYVSAGGTAATVNSDALLFASGATQAFGNGTVGHAGISGVGWTDAEGREGFEKIGPDEAVDEGAGLKRVHFPEESLKVNVENGTLSPEKEYFKNGENVSLKADAPEEGKEFDKWTTEDKDVSFADPSAPDTSFTMPGKAVVTVSANYKDKKSDPDNPDNPGKGSTDTPSMNNVPTDYTVVERGQGYLVSYPAKLPFFWKSKLKPSDLGDGFSVSANGKSYKVSKMKVNRKKKRIQITGLEGADKTLNKAIKKETKGSKGLTFEILPFNVSDSTEVSPKVKNKKGTATLKSVKVKVFGEKLYKAKKDEFRFSSDSKYIEFTGSNLNGKWLYR